MKKILKKLLGVDKIEEEVAEAIKQKLEIEAQTNSALEAAKLATEQKRLAKLSPKELATERKEPWVAVLDTHINKENVRNGFFELDWNEYFVLQLKTAGYDGESDEAIVDQWFQDLCRGVGAEAGVDMERRGSGYINVNNLGNGRSEIS